MKTHVQMLGYWAFAIVGLWTVASLISPGLIPDTESSWILLTGLAIALSVSAWWGRPRQTAVPVSIDRGTRPRTGV